MSLTGVTWIHVAGGMFALAAGASAAVARKGSRVHALAGTCFCAAMLVLGITAAILAPFKTPPDSPLGGVVVCYFVVTAWLTAHRRSGRAGLVDKLGCAIILAIAAATIGQGFLDVRSPDPGSAGPPGLGGLLVFGGICLLAGLMDLRFIRHGPLAARQRIARHVWRMCVAFFIATGSFFLGQQDVLPEMLRGSALLFVPALAPLALMIVWLLRLRLSKTPSGLVWPG